MRAATASGRCSDADATPARERTRSAGAVAVAVAVAVGAVVAVALAAPRAGAGGVLLDHYDVHLDRHHHGAYLTRLRYARPPLPPSSAS